MRHVLAAFVGAVLIALAGFALGGDQKVNSEKLLAELQAAGIPATGCDCNGRVTGARPEDADAVAKVLAAHDPSPTIAQAIKATGHSPAEAALVLVASKTATQSQRTWAQGVLEDEAKRIGGAFGGK